ncbi:CCD17 protein, partial [Upupa epops]|nr:CCD17 protein [Upupa epops]
ALHLSYVCAGGHDPAILDQLLHLHLEATAVEKGATGLHGGKRMAMPAEASSTGEQGLDAALLATELENQRLEDEILALKVRRERKANAASQVAQWHAEELAQLQAEVGMLRCHPEQIRPYLPSAILPSPLAPSL